VVGFIAPTPFLLALDHAMARGNSLITVQGELTTKAIQAFSVFLATWIVARLERPLDDL
jgi:hypothetical protein